MAKIFLGFLILVQVCIIPLLLFLILGFLKTGGNFSILLPGLGVVINGSFLLAVLLVTEIIFFALSLIIVRRLRRDSGKLT